MIEILPTVIMPNSLISAGVSGKNIRRNRRAELASGEKKINIGWSVPYRQFTFGTVPLTVSQWQALEGLHEVTEGGAYGFLMLDPKDSFATVLNGKATLISAPAHTYQLIKTYTSVGSSLTKNRTIKRPILAGFAPFASGSPIGSYSLNVDTGVITIPSDPVASTVTWLGRFYTPVHFENDEIDWDLVIGGPADARFMAGPSVVLTEVRE